MHIAFFSMNWINISTVEITWHSLKIVHVQQLQCLGSCNINYVPIILWTQTCISFNSPPHYWTLLQKGNGTACMPLHSKKGFKWTAMFKMNSPWTCCPWWKSFNTTEQIITGKKKSRYMVEMHERNQISNRLLRVFPEWRVLSIHVGRSQRND